jgi:hypothetical protein
MNKTKIIFYIILIIGLIILFSFLGGNRENFTDKMHNTNKHTNEYESDDDDKYYDNYNHYSGLRSSLMDGSIFYGPKGGIIVVNTDSDGKQFLNVRISSDSSNDKYTSKPFTKKFFGPNDEIAFVIKEDNQNAIKVVTSNGYYIFRSNDYRFLKKKHDDKNKINKHHSDYKKYNNTPNTYYGSTGVVYSPSSFPNNAYTSLDEKNNSSGQYNSVLPQGIPKSQIPPGDEDLYILKSQVVPPVCPACPTCPQVNQSNNSSVFGSSFVGEEKCPPCPACARCPEPSFECKKVPNYSAINNDYLPVPVLNDFSTFGM